MQKFFKKYWHVILLGLIVLLGFLLRLKGLLGNSDLWHDECALAWNVKYRNFGDYFGILRFMQMAPPFFMIMVKIITNVFGISNISLRILPFFAGVASIIAFYFLAEKTLKSKTIALWAVFLFVINQRLIGYSFEFKQYNFDVFFAIICLLFFINLDWEKLKAKKAVLYGVLLSIVPWLSFTSAFIIAGGIINILFNVVKNKAKNLLFPLSAFLFPLVISCLIYLKIYLVNNYTGTHMVNYWHDSFLNLDPVFFFSILVSNLRYFFFSMQYILLAIILLIAGINIFYKEKSQFIRIFSISFALLVILSLLHIYPFRTRLILFLLPMFLLLMMKPLDKAMFDKKIKLAMVLLITALTFYSQIVAINSYIHVKNISRGEYPHEMLDYMMKNIKKGDNIFVNSASDVEFYYYSSFYDVKNNVIQERVTNESPEKYTAFLNGLKHGYYWFYLPYDSSLKPVFQYILPWVESQKILYIVKKNKSVLMYVYVN